LNDKNKVALVTGCSRSQGIGFEVCRQLGQLGLAVFLTARDAGKAQALASTLRDEGLDVTGHALDISSANSTQIVIDVIGDRHGKLDILVNNATGSAGRDMAPPSTADLDVARQVIDVTLLGTWRITQAAIPLLGKSSCPRIVNVSSSAGLHSDPVLGLTGKAKAPPAYGIAKAALNALTARFADELAETGIKVNAVCPGFTATFPRMEALGARPVAEGAKGIVWAALLDDSGPTGGFYRDNKLLEW
jgi:NAD(P)-dependent dehydrogenase (short-subunit alcohol dehydrogenase family)